MLRVGITGGIGSGKSVVARVFNNLGIPVYDADEAAKKLMESDPALVAGIKAAFGEATFTDGRLNRSFLSAQVFQNKEKLTVLNKLVHPVTIADAAYWMKAQEGPYALKEAALIFESGSNRDLDYVIGVFAPQELRIKRVMKRNEISREAVIKRMENQNDDLITRKLIDFAIENDEVHLLLPQVITIHNRLLALSANSTD